jgi:hypothetical protein
MSLMIVEYFESNNRKCYSLVDNYNDLKREEVKKELLDSLNDSIKQTKATLKVSKKTEYKFYPKN